MKLLRMSFLQHPVTSPPLGPAIPLSAHNPFSYLNERDQVSHPYKTGQIIILYILIFTCIDSRREEKAFLTMW
jgi:hypothetical protein